MTASRPQRQPPAVEFDAVSFAFDEHVILDNVSFTIPVGSMRVLLGPSGTGKSIVLKLILGLYRPDSGRILVNGQRIDTLSERELLQVRADVGMLFQETALFDSLTVFENVGYRLYEETEMPADQAEARVQEVLGFVGLGEYADRMPSELSGGQRRRVAVARAMAARPRILLLDEPTSGLDPITARTVDAAILALRDLEHVTTMLVTHQLEDAFYMASHEFDVTEHGPVIVPAPHRSAREVTFLVLNDGVITFAGGIDALMASHDPYISRSLSGWVPALHA